MKISPAITSLTGLIAATFIACSWPTSGTGKLSLNPPDGGVPRMGQQTALEFTVRDTEHGVCQVVAFLTQGELRLELELKRLSAKGDAKKPSEVTVSATARSWLTAGFTEGEAKLTADSVNCSLFRGKSQHTAGVMFDYTPPRVELTSSQHHINQGGAELVTYRVDDDIAWSGVRVGGNEFRGYPKPDGGDSSEQFAFFVYAYDLPKDSPIEIVARDAAGNEGKTTLTPARFFPKQFRARDIAVDDEFIKTKVADIIANTPGMKATGDLLDDFLNVNRRLRRDNAEFLLKIAARSEPVLYWKDAFKPLPNASIESSFADFRDYFYGGKKVDEQVHLGFDLAVVEKNPVSASADGKVLYIGYLGIYGNTVVVDHGYGITTLYAHLSAIDVSEGDPVRQGEILGRSGATGLAGGDHLHFSLLIQGVQTNPVEFWDQHWIKDHVYLRLDNKLFGQVAVKVKNTRKVLPTVTE